MPADVDPPRSNTPTLDVREVPLWRRLPLILGAVGQLESGAALELVVDLDPWLLRNVLESTTAGGIDWDDVESGPEVWRVRLSCRRA
jgi:uncharacterized protein (DUF2249 family)